MLEEEKVRAGLVEKYRDKLEKIKVILTDIDGVMTDASIIWVGGDAGFTRIYNAHDGYGISYIQKHGIEVGFVTGGDSDSVRMRAQYLKIKYLFLGKEDKREAFKEVMNDGYSADEIFYMGDEIFDVPLLKKAGFSACPADANIDVKKHVDYITRKGGGKACLREVIDMIALAQGIIPSVEDFD